MENNLVKKLIKLAQYCFGPLLSVCAIVYLMNIVDFSYFINRQFEIKYWYLILGMILTFLTYYANAIRWRHILEIKISQRTAFFSTVIGFGANVILPARGGDLLKLVFLKRYYKCAIMNSVTRLFLEKALDLIVLFFLAILSTAIYLKDSIKTYLIVFFFSFLLILIFGLLKYRVSFFLNMAGFLFEKVSFLKPYIKQCKEAISDLSKFLTFRNLLFPIMLSFFIWFVLEILIFYFIITALNINLNYFSLALIISFSAIGISLPSAPSGIGVFHATVLIGFQLMNYTAEEGMLAATILHLIFSLPVAIAALVIYMTVMINHRIKGKKELTNGNC